MLHLRLNARSNYIHIYDLIISSLSSVSLGRTSSCAKTAGRHAARTYARQGHGQGQTAPMKCCKVSATHQTSVVRRANYPRHFAAAEEARPAITARRASHVCICEIHFWQAVKVTEQHSLIAERAHSLQSTVGARRTHTKHSAARLASVPPYRLRLAYATRGRRMRYIHHNSVDIGEWRRAQRKRSLRRRSRSEIPNAAARD